MDFLSLRQACLFLAIVALTPLAIYILRRNRDPFNPLILIGVISFGIADWKLLTDPQPALNYLRAPTYVEYLLIVTISLLSLYAGWYWWKSRHRRDHRPSVHKPIQYHYQPARMFRIGWLMAAMTFVGTLLSMHNVHATGFVTDWAFMQAPAAVILIQALLLERNLLWPVIAGLAIDLFGSIYWVFTHGSRGGTAILLALLAVPFLLRGKHPRKHWVLIVGFAAVIAMLSLAQTRSIIGKGEATNRIAALMVVGKQLLHGGKHHYGPGREFVVGAAEVDAVQILHNWDYGLFAWDVLATFPPRQWFPDKGQWQSAWGQGAYLQNIKTATGLPYLTGAAPTGFAVSFVEFGWFFPVFWFLLGYFMHHLYGRAVYTRRLDYQGYLVLIFVVVLYLITQDFMWGSFHFLFTLLPAFLAYQYARVGRSVIP